VRDGCAHIRRHAMIKAGILWMLGVPLFVIVLLALFTNIL
jgi:hypothetical protein